MLSAAACVACLTLRTTTFFFFSASSAAFLAALETVVSSEKIHLNGLSISYRNAFLCLLLPRCQV